METPAVSIVIPVYNEVRGLPQTIDRLRAVLAGLPPGSELMFVDDGSRDGSRALLEQHPAAAEFTLLTHRRNRGYGAALKTGIRHARNGWIAIADADGTYPLEKIPALLEVLVREEAAMVVGARSVSQQPLVRRPAKAVLRALAQYLTGQRIPDLNSGLRVFRRDDALRLYKLLPDGFSFTTTITMALLTEGEHVVFQPIRYRERVGSSKIRPIHDTINFLMLICRTAVAFNPLKVFAPTGFLLLLAGFGLLVARTMVEHTFGLATTIVLIVGGLQLLALGLFADLVNRRG